MKQHQQPMSNKLMWMGLMVMVTLAAAKVRITKADLVVAKQMLKPQVPASSGWPVRTATTAGVQRQYSTDGYGSALPPQGHSIAPAAGVAPPMPMMMMMQPQFDSQPILPPSAPSGVNSYGSAPPPNPQVSSYGSALTPMSYGPPPPPPQQQTGYGAPSAYGPAPAYYEEEEEPDCEKESKFSKLKGKMQHAVKGSVDKQKERLDALKEMVKQAAEVQKDMLRSFKEQLKEIKKKQPEPEEPAVYYPAPAPVYGSAPAPAPSGYGSAPAPVYSSMPPMPVPYPVMQQPSYISTPTAPAPAGPLSNVLMPASSTSYGGVGPAHQQPSY